MVKLSKSKPKPRKKGDVTTLAVGEKLTITSALGVKQLVVVHEWCGSTDAGHWFCATHGKGTELWDLVVAHTNKGKHEMLWLCKAHGPEGREWTGDD